MLLSSWSDARSRSRPPSTRSRALSSSFVMRGITVVALVAWTLMVVGDSVAVAAKSHRLLSALQPHLLLESEAGVQANCPSNGHCQDITKLRCETNYQPNLICPGQCFNASETNWQQSREAEAEEAAMVTHSPLGNNNIQCCIPAPAPTTCPASGSCADVGTSDCASGWKPNLLCPGAANIQCCEARATPKPPPPPPAPATCPGTCQNINERACASGWQPNLLCPGGNDIQASRANRRVDTRNSVLDVLGWLTRRPDRWLFCSFQCCEKLAPPPATGAMCVSSNGIDLITSFEGFRNDFYIDASGTCARDLQISWDRTRSADD